MTGNAELQLGPWKARSGSPTANFGGLRPNPRRRDLLASAFDAAAMKTPAAISRKGRSAPDQRPQHSEFAVGELLIDLGFDALQLVCTPPAVSKIHFG